MTADETALRAVIARIDAAWRENRFEGLELCFHPDAEIVGPGYVPAARGRDACARSYVEFARDTEVLEYTESTHSLRVWGTTAVCTFAWEMLYRRAEGPSRERGTDLLVFRRSDDEGWQVVFRHLSFEPVTGA
jgi:uncharacterized protein (TIGR02246 family)